MKKLFSFISVFALVAILGVSSVSAQKTVVTMEKLWSKTIADMGVTTAETRQGVGLDGKVILLSKKDQSLVAISAEGKDTICVGPLTVAEGVTANLDGTAYALDDAANFVMVGTFPSTPSHIVLRKADGSVVKDLAITGLARTDFINATGDVFSAEGGHVFVYGNGVNLLVYTIANGELVGEPTTVAVAGVSGGNYVIAGDDKVQIAHHRSSGSWKKIENGVATALEMPDHKASTLGGDIFTLAGKEFYVYPVGKTAYSSEFSVRNMTDGAFVVDKADGQTTIFCANTMDKNPGATSVACWLNVSKIDDDNAYIHVYNAGDGAAVYKVSAVVAATVTLNVNDAAMGTVEGAGDVAVGGKATIKAIPNVGHSFVAWLNGTDTVATTAEYTFEVKEDVALTAHFQKEADVKLNLAVNDATLGAITLPEGIVMGENTVAYGTKVALTAVPAEGCTFMGWYAGDALYNAAYTIEVALTADLALTAKFVKVLNLEYELNDGVTNDYGWTSKGAVALELQKDYNAAYGTSKEWAKAENGYVYYNLNGTWTREDQVPEGTSCEIVGFIQNVTYNESDNLKKLITDTHKDKYAWLYDVMVAARIAGGLGVAEADLVENTYRKELSAFFLCSPAADGWPKSPTYATIGNYESFKAIWKHGFDNPTEIVAEVVLNMPYKEGYTFDGWYTNAEFTGEPVVTVSPESVIEGGKLYAKWIEYIPTIAEVRAMEDGTETKVKGVVNHVGGKTIYVEDASGLGMDIYMANSGLQAGQEVVVKGKVTKAKGWPRLEGEEVVSAKAGKFFEPVAITSLSELVNDSTYKYYARRVAISGLTVAKYADNGDVYFTDGINEVLGYYMKLDQTKFPVNKVVNINGAVAAWYGENFQFTGDVASVTLAPKGLVDTYAYPTRHEKYNLKNEWIYSTQHGNYKGNEPGAYDMVRGMVARDGKMYFAERRGQAPYEGYIVVVDGATGDKLDPIKIKGDHLFMRQDTTGAWSLACQYPFNDIKMDNAGNCLVGACLTSSKQNFYIYTVDLTTGEATELINENLLDNPDFAEAAIDFRFDAFGVSGDVKGNACIMAADSKDGWRVYRWLIKEGVVGKAEMITLKPTEKNCIALKQDIAGVGTAPQIFPQDETGKYFYVDGSSTNPILFDESGTVIEDFIYCPTGRKVWNNEGDTIEMTATQPNGVCEFEVNGEYFVAMVAEYVTGSKSTKFALYKYDNEWRTFLEMEPLWYFPNDGMGSDQYQGRSAVPYVDVVGNTAHIYLYATNNGYAAYTLTVEGDGGGGQNAVEDIEAVTVGAKKVVKNGQVYIIKNGVVYTLLGAEVK